MNPLVRSTPRCLWPAGATLGEGTLWSPRRQALYWVDILERRLWRYCPATGGHEQWSFDEEISAVAERRGSPGLLVTLRSGFALFDPDTGALQRLHDPEAAQPGNRFNDGKCDEQGRFWAGTMDAGCTEPTGALYSYDTAGRCRRWDHGYPVTNGPAWSADQRSLYVNDTVHAHTFVFDVDPVTGTLGNKRLWTTFGPDEGYPDGMTTDAAGRLWMCHWGAARVTCRDPLTAQELARIDLPTDHITNVAFGGADLRTLFITSARSGLTPQQLAEQPLAGALFAVDLAEPGRPAGLYGG